MENIWRLLTTVQVGGAILLLAVSLVLLHWGLIWRRQKRGKSPILDHHWKLFDYIWYSMGFLPALMLAANVRYNHLKTTVQVYEASVAAVRDNIQDALFEQMNDCATIAVSVPTATPPGRDAFVQSDEPLILNFSPKDATRYSVKETSVCQYLNAIWNAALDLKTIDVAAISKSSGASTDAAHAALIRSWNHWVGEFREVTNELRKWSALSELNRNWSLVFAVAVAIRITKSSGERSLAKARAAA